MDKVLVDTSIVLDLLSQRENFFEPAQWLFSLADKKKVNLYVSSLTLANAHYILAKNSSNAITRTVLRSFKVLVEVLPMDDKIVELALNSNFNDFEDAIQYYTAIENELDLIVTRNIKDFTLSKIPVVTAYDYLILFKSNHPDSI